jgi:hypothetical protein
MKAAGVGLLAVAVGGLLVALLGEALPHSPVLGQVRPWAEKLFLFAGVGGIVLLKASGLGRRGVRSTGEPIGRKGWIAQDAGEPVNFWSDFLSDLTVVGWLLFLLSSAVALVPALLSIWPVGKFLNWPPKWFTIRYWLLAAVLVASFLSAVFMLVVVVWFGLFFGGRWLLETKLNVRVFKKRSGTSKKRSGTGKTT